MGNTAILIGNSHYRSLSTLLCCHADLMAMKGLLEATQKYSDIAVIENTDADDLKSRIRAAIDNVQSKEELFFYFTGHGCQQEDDFYHCATKFNSRRPNETGLSTVELHALLRLADTEVVVKVIDACNSGTLLIKADGTFQSYQKQGFNNLIQISSCRESQNSLTGEPLSIFTENFRAAALRKEKGTVYYTDIISTLRDTFIHNNDQTPHFVFQVTGREQFVDNARRLDNLRAHLLAESKPGSQPETEDTQVMQRPASLRDLLEVAEEKSATTEIIQSFVNTFFDNLIQKISNDEFADFFDLNIVENSDLSEPTTEAFIIRVLSRQDRFDEFVTATVKKERIRNPLQLIGTSVLLGMFGDDQRYRKVYDLQLNCEMQRTQIKFTFTPKFHSLKQLILVVTCAPSLQNCYIFELGTQHNMTDFGEFNFEGNEAVRRWYRLQWSEHTDGIVEKISLGLHEMVRKHLERTEQSLTSEES